MWDLGGGEPDLLLVLCLDSADCINVGFAVGSTDGMPYEAGDGSMQRLHRELQ
jgi:hypothetical protein